MHIDRLKLCAAFRADRRPQYGFCFPGLLHFLCPLCIILVLPRTLLSSCFLNSTARSGRARPADIGLEIIHAAQYVFSGGKIAVNTALAELVTYSVGHFAPSFLRIFSALSALLFQDFSHKNSSCCSKFCFLLNRKSCRIQHKPFSHSDIVPVLVLALAFAFLAS